MHLVEWHTYSLVNVDLEINDKPSFSIGLLCFCSSANEQCIDRSIDEIVPRVNSKKSKKRKKVE